MALTIAQTVALYDLLHAGTPIEIIYATAGDELKQRTIRPVSDSPIREYHGYDIVSAFDSLRQDVRYFRVDRIRAVTAIYV